MLSTPLHLFEDRPALRLQVHAPCRLSHAGVVQLDQDVFTLGSRKYAPAESGVAEMCNMYCHRAGRELLSM